MRNFSICLLACLLVLSISQTTSPSECCGSNIFSVVGAGTVKVDPDIARFTITIKGQKKTSIEALSFVNQLVSKVNNILSYYQIPVGDRTTSSINLRPVYRYDRGASFLIGQEASSSIRVAIGNLKTDPSKIGKLIKSLSSVSNSSINGFSFENKNNEIAIKSARKAAVDDALLKARQYSVLTGRKTISIKKVEDQNLERYVPFFMNANEYAFQSQLLTIPYGKVEVSAYVQIDWNL